MIYTLEDFIREYRKIKEMGWIRTHRVGPTGVGKTTTIAKIASKFKVNY